MALEQGYEVGGNGFPFDDSSQPQPYSEPGCTVYTSGIYQGRVYFGTYDKDEVRASPHPSELK